MDKSLCILQKTTVREAISVLVDGGKKTVFIVDSDNILLGLMTNGDMRRFLLTGRDLGKPVTEAMNSSPMVFSSLREIKEQVHKKPLIVYPIVDEQMHLLDAVFADQMGDQRQNHHELDDIPLVIMAGGKGTRLYPYTKILPKAIIPIGQFSITERIIKSFQQFGCHKVYMVLNHKASLIKAYIQEANTGCEIEFVQEDKFSGTAGGLALLRDKLHSTFFLSNCDILINDDLGCVYDTHCRNNNQITYVGSMLNQTIPYGVLKTDSKGQIINILEKPQYSFLASTGVYVLEPEVLDQIIPGEFIHMTDLTERCIQKNMRAGVFPISEKAWLDMGQIEDMKQMLQILDADPS